MKLIQKRTFLFVTAVLTAFNAFSQDDLRKIIPPSPTVASLGSYGDTKISYYTGSPNISIPLHTISAGDLSLPVSLSYNAKGVKVEELATWTGLGWSLNAGGVITRSVRGGQDELGNGYMSASLKVSDMRALWPSYNWLDMAVPGFAPYPDDTFTARMRDIADGLTDAEADIFYFNFAGYSGKFYYNQDKGTFVSIPQNTLSFDKAYFLTNNAWHLIAENGVEYYFELTEKNLNYSQCNGSPSTPQQVTTGWFLTRVYSPSTGQQINLSYNTATYTQKNIASYTLNSSEGGSITSCVQNTKLCYSVNSYSGYRLSSIQYDGGRLDFKALTDRCDLLGDKQLDYIEMYNTGDVTPYRKFHFGYSYYNNNLVPVGTCSEETSYNVRLKLVSLKTLDGSGAELPPHTFEYNETVPMPNRMSYSQDAWGYFNNASNSHLVPPFLLRGVYLSGANRTVDTTYTGVGVLKKIVYPTGGSTEFEFENNKVTDYIKYSTNKYLVNRSEILDATNDCNGSDPAPVFCKTVVINDQRGLGGAYVNFRVNNMYCWNCSSTPPPAPTSCAILSLGGIQIVCNTDYTFVPNGTYILSADFRGSPTVSNYQDFSIRLFWEEYNPPAGTHEASVGGLRVKKITDKDDLGNSKIKQYEYEGGNLSDAKFFFEYELACNSVASSGNGSSGSSTPFYVRSSYSNIPLGSAAGSTFGYGKVTEKQIGNTNNGKSVYYFSTAGTYPDIANDGFPFGDPISFDHRRGLLLKQEDYRWTNNNYQLIKSVENDYKPLDIVFDWEQFDLGNTDPLYDETLNIRAAYLDIWNDGTKPYAWPIMYKTVSEWIRQTKTTERQYDYSGNYNEIVSYNVYGNPSHQQATEAHLIKSNGTEQITLNKYPLDYSPVASTTNGIKQLRDKHYINSLIEKVTLERNSSGADYVTNSVLISYNGYQLPNQTYHWFSGTPLPLSSFTASGFTNDVFQMDSRYVKGINFTYNSNLKNKLVEQQKELDARTSYVWGYNATLPIAEVKNAPAVSIFHTSFEDDGVAGVAVTGKKYYSGSSYTIPTANRPVGSNLKMTYWYNDGSWKLRSEVNYSPTIAEANATAYDEVRVCPAGSLMTTYTHTPGFGITTSNDPNNKITFFDYDTFGRLVTVRDDQKKIMKSYTYHLKNQQAQ